MIVPPRAGAVKCTRLPSKVAVANLAVKYYSVCIW